MIATAGLAHSDGLVRDHALRSMALAGEHSAIGAGTAFGVISTFGAEAFSWPLQVCDLPLDSATLSLICDAHDRMPRPEIANWLRETPQELLVANAVRTTALKDPSLRQRLQARIELQSVAPEMLWDRLTQSPDRATLLALCTHDAFISHQLPNVAQNDPRRRMLLEMAGRAHIGGAVPTLLDAMSSSDNALIETAINALARLGTSGAVTAIEQRCDREGPAFRARAAKCLARIRVPSVETVLQRLLAQEDDPSVARELIQALVDVCTTQSFDTVVTYARARGDAGIRQGVAALSILLNRPVPETPTWRGPRELHDTGFALAFAAKGNTDRALEPQSTPRTPIRAADKAGRNDPCPCGSGRKYKKCCGA